MGRKITIEQLLSVEDAFECMQELTFEDGLALLEELVDSVEAGELPLDKAVASYERGVRLIERLRSQLAGAEKKLKLLEESKEAGREEKKIESP